MRNPPWHSESFHNWLIRRIDFIVSGEPRQEVSVSGVRRPVEEDDFGFSAKTLNRWRKELPDSSYPDGKKIRDIIFSPGFVHFSETERHCIFILWIAEELGSAVSDLSDEIIGSLNLIVEKSSPDFLMKCLSDIRAL